MLEKGMISQNEFDAGQEKVDVGPAE